MVMKEWTGYQPRRVRAPGRIPGPGPGCRLGAGERAGEHAAVGRGPFQAKTVKSKSPVLFFIFSGKLNMQIGSKEK